MLLVLRGICEESIYYIQTLSKQTPTLRLERRVLLQGTKVHILKGI